MADDRATEPLDTVYQVTFGSGALLPPGGLVVRRGKVGGIGNYHGAYSGSARMDAGGMLDLDIGVRVDVGVPIATGLKAGPAGSTIYFKARLAVPASVSTCQIDLAGNKGTMTLGIVDVLRPVPMPDDTSVGSAHPDAFPDGIYRIESAGVGYTTRTVTVLNAGQYIGVGEMGGHYRGTYVFDAVRKLTNFVGEAKLPAGVPLVVGSAAGPEGLTVPLTSEGKYNRGTSRFSLSMAGRSIDALMTYQQALPG